MRALTLKDCPMKPSRALLSAASVLTATALLTACGSSDGTAKTTTAGKAAATDLSGITLTLGDQANSLKTLFSAAGVLKGTPYKVKFAEFEGAAPLFQAMQSGDVDTGYAADLPSLAAISGGLKIKLVEALKSSGASTGVLTQKGSSVKTVADLKGKNVVVSSARGSIAEYLLANALQQAGLKYSDVKVQYVLPTAAQAAFSSQKIQNWATFGVYQATALAGGGRQIVDGQNGRTSGLGFVSAASSSIADPSKKAAIADVLKRLDRAVRWSVANKDAYVTAFTKATGVAPAVADTVVSQGATTALPVSSAVVTTVQAVADLMHGIGSLPTDVKVADQVDASLFTG
jgi:sulfonate transport system substrate-binding protein